MDTPYSPTQRFDNVNLLYGNHFRFDVEALPELTFFAQSVTTPVVQVSVAEYPNPFVKIPQVGDHLQFATFDVAYLVDSQFKNYFSLFYWLKGYGFPKSYEDIAEFTDFRKRQIPNPKPLQREVFKTNATLYILQPDTDATIAEIRFEDVFPTAIGQVEFSTTPTEPVVLTTRATFHYTDFDVALIRP